jgi:hypothetical protein
MKRAKAFRIPLSEGDMLDVKLEIENGVLKGFVLNLRCKIEHVWFQVYRAEQPMDTCMSRGSGYPLSPYHSCSTGHCNTCLSFTWNK